MFCNKIKKIVLISLLTMSFGIAADNTLDPVIGAGSGQIDAQAGQTPAAEGKSLTEKLVSGTEMLALDLTCKAGSKVAEILRENIEEHPYATPAMVIAGCLFVKWAWNKWHVNLRIGGR